MNEGLFSAYAALPEWKQLLGHIEKAESTALAGISEGERAFLAAALAYRTGRPVLLLCATELAAQRHAQDISRLFGEGCVMLPPRELQFSRAAASQESTWQRLQVLSTLMTGRIRVLCLPIEGMTDRLLPAQLFRDAILRVGEGKSIPPEKLLTHLIQSGYERVAMVEGRGQCAMRGSIVDVFPPSETEAVRIEFFGDEVDSIRRFDCISQRSIARVKAVVIPPAAECLPPNPVEAAERLRKSVEDYYASKRSEKQNVSGEEQQDDELPSLDDFLLQLDVLEEGERSFLQQKPAVSMQEVEHEEPLEVAADVFGGGEGERNLTYKRHLDDVERVRAGHPLRTGPMWMNVLCPQTVSVMEYLPNALVVCDQPEQWQTRVRARREAFEKAYEDAHRRADAFPAQKDLLLSYDCICSEVEKTAAVVFSDLRQGLGQLKPEHALHWICAPVMPYQSRLEALCKDINVWKEKNASIVLLTGGEARGKRLQRALAEQNMPSVYVEQLNGNLIAREVILLPVAYSKGFVNLAAGLCLVSDTDLYGTAYQRARKKQTAGERIASFTDLKTGDYVVHDFHGVAQYMGIIQMTSEGVTRDYLLLQYAGSDKLYVPTDQFDRVQKYIGSESSSPKLNHLGGTEWQRQKGKVKSGLKKLAFDLAELYARRQQETGYAFSDENPWQSEFEDAFPYELTHDQQQSVDDIHQDMQSKRNMDRLLCGDVGYGKTEVALRSAFKAVTEGKQVALLAPTTILVQQHFHTIQKRFQGFPVTVEMLSRFRSAKEQKLILQRLKDGEIDMIVGTHRLLAKDVKFKDLGLLIVDEEHRFGVSHKESIKNMKARVDVLTLSATPIPRTLHMSMSGIRDMSLLETPPEERLPVKTYVLEYSDEVVKEAIRREMGRGGQVYFLYNRVRSIEQMHMRLKALVPEARIGIAHGQMRENALEDVMLDFYAGAYDVLLCTTIIESGLDVPEANTLIVFDADRFGLSQLYQIRGRVGRSSRQAYAYFTTRVNKMLSEAAEKRLSAIREFTEFGAGYRIAMRDLEIRGAGDVLGPQQHGHLSTVGYDMYLKLMEQVVGEVQGLEEKPELDTRIELSINAYLPDEYIGQELLRIEIYKRIAMIEDEEGRLDIEEELIDRFGDIPAPVDNLARIAQLRAVTRRLGISHLQLKQDGVHLRIDADHMPDPEHLFVAMQKTDRRMMFNARKTAEIVVKQPDLSAEDALALCIQLLTTVLAKVREQQKEQEKCVGTAKGEAQVH